MPLRDILRAKPRILFVGINPGLRSEALGHHFAGPGNPFWRLLHASKLTPRLLSFEEDAAMADFGLALTNFCSRATRAASELTPRDFEEGRKSLLRKIGRTKPKTVAFVGVTLYRRCFKAALAPGPGAKPETIAGARVFVLPNPSGLNRGFPRFSDKLLWFSRLSRFAQNQKTRRPKRSPRR
ncbi:MAG: mismatch-specific DNA-glycosylase [Elusimicrobiota bacterium]